MGHGPYPSVGAGGGISPQVQQWFAAVDKDQSGFISAAELKSALVNAQGQNFSDSACLLMIGMSRYIYYLFYKGFLDLFVI